MIRNGLAIWYGLLATERRAELIDSGTGHARGLLRIALRRRAAGDIDSLEVLRAQLPLAYALNDSIAIAAERNSLLVAASSAIGIPSDQTFLPRFDEAPPPPLDALALLAAAVESDPTIRLLRARRLLADAERDASAAGRRPTFDLGLGVASVDGSWGYLQGGVTVGLPIGRWGEDPATESHRFLGEVIDLEIRRRERLLHARIDLAIAEIEGLQRQLEQYDATILPLLRESWRTAMILYREGATGYLNVIEAHEQLLDGELERLDLELRLRQHHDRLTLLTTPLSPAGEEE